MTRIRVSLVAAAVCLIAAGCSSGADHAIIHVDHADVLADQAVHLTVTGLEPHAQIIVGSEAVDRDGKKWHADASFTADDHGTIDLDQAKPSGGSYHDVDGMGLFWSMNPPDGNPDIQSYRPPSDNHRPAEHVDIVVRKDGKDLARTTLTRQWLSSGVTTKFLSLTKDKVLGTYVAPRPDHAKHPAVLVFGGSEGGNATESIAALLASHGYPTLSVAYFAAPGLPKELRDVPLEYFVTAAQWLERQPEVDPAHVLVMSASRGTEAALLLSEHFPKLIHGAVLYAPASVIHGSFPDDVGEPWTLHGHQLPEELIPVDHVDGPVLAVAGTDDLIWASTTAAPLIVQELDNAHNRFAHRALVFPDAGHGVSGAPYQPHGTSLVHPVTGLTEVLGGTRAANESALRQGWSMVLALLRSLS